MKTHGLIVSACVLPLALFACNRADERPEPNWLGAAGARGDVDTTAKDDEKTMPADQKLPEGKVVGSAKLEARSGTNTTGAAQFSATEMKIDGLGTKQGAIVVRASFENAEPGNHGIHLHEKGDCSSADAESAGDHWNPGKNKHGGPRDAYRHAGDLGNVVIGADGKGTLEVAVLVPGVKKDELEKALIGRSLVLHAKTDDLKSDPAGNAGARIACGVIVADTAAH